MRPEVIPDIAISARNVTLSLGTGEAKTEVLRGIDLDVSAGDRRSEERRVGKECERLCRSRWSPYH